MRSTRILALAAAMALPFGATSALAAPAGSSTAGAAAKAEAAPVIVDVRQGGGFRSLGGHGGHGGGGGGGGGGHHGGGGGHWHGGGGHWHGHHHRFRPRWYGVPYYYDPGFYEYSYDDYDDDVYVRPSSSAMARCKARYRSFDPRTGTFLSTSGKRKVCPYLR